MTPTPLLVRAGVFTAALASLLLATPAVLPLPLLLAGAVLLSALPAIAPAGPWATVATLAAAAGWLAGSSSPLVLVLAALLYLLHSLSALAATLPYDAIVAPDVVVRWLLRTAAVIAAGALLSAVVLAGLAVFAGDRVHAAVTLAGLALALLLVRAIVPRVTGRFTIDGG
jgi:hypothetical protein